MKQTLIQQKKGRFTANIMPETSHGQTLAGEKVKLTYDAHFLVKYIGKNKRWLSD